MTTFYDLHSRPITIAGPTGATGPEGPSTLENGAAFTQLATALAINGAFTSHQAECDTTGVETVAAAVITPETSSTTDVIVTFTAIKSDDAANFKQDVEACFAVSSLGVVTEMGTNTPTTAKTNGVTAGLACAIAINGGNIEPQVTGIAGTFRWTANVTVMSRTSVAAI